MGDPSALSVLQRKRHNCQVLLWLKQTYQVQDGKCDFVLSKELVYQAYLAMSTTHEDLAALPRLTRPVLGKMVKRAFPSVPSIRRGPRGRVKQLYVGLVPQTHRSTRAGLNGRAKRRRKNKNKKIDVEEDEEVEHLLLDPFSVVGSTTRRRSDNEEEGEDCGNDGDGELEENETITTSTTTTKTDEEEQTRRCSLETTATTTFPTTLSTPPTLSSSSTTTRSGSSHYSGDRTSPRSSLDSTIASPSLSSSFSSSSATTGTFFASSSSPLPDTQPGSAYQGPEAEWNGGANRHRDSPNQPRPRAKVADMTDWARRAERLGRYRVMIAQTSSAGEVPGTREGRTSVVEWVELIIPAELQPS